MPYFLRFGVLTCLAASLLAGCVSTTRNTTPASASAPSFSHTSSDPAAMQCTQSEAQWAVGKTNTANTVEQARQRANAHIVRVLHPDSAGSLSNTNSGQLILIVNTEGRITHAFCR